MTTPRTDITHRIGGGWATDYSPTAAAAPGRDGSLVIPYLLKAENMVFERSGAARKVPGSTKVNSSQLESGADIVGVYDAWFSGTTGSSTQHRIVSVNGEIYKDDADGTFTSILAGLSAGAPVCFTMLEDLLIMGFHSTDVPKSWDGSTAQSLAGTPPNFGICTVHAGRLWVADVWANPSYVYYSPYLDPENATSEGWGRIAVEPDDGDIITGMASHRGELIVFKGPYKGSIHRIQGTAPTGSDAFRKPPPLVRGVTAAWHNLIFPLGVDLGFMTPTGQVQTLTAVQQYGDFDAVALSRGLKAFSKRINFSRLNQAWAATNTDDDLVAFMLPVDGSTSCNFMLVMDYTWDPPRFLQWPVHAGTSIASGVDGGANNARVFYAGGTDGYLRKLGQQARTVDTTTPIGMVVQAPYLDYGKPFHMKTLGEGFVEFTPRNNGDIDFLFRRDSNNAQTIQVSQGGGDPLGTVSGSQFTLGTSVLAESTAVKRFFEVDDGGDFRGVQFEIQNDALGEDIEIHSFGMTIEMGGISTENSM